MNNLSMYEAMTDRRAVTTDQKAWKFIRDVNSMSSDILNRVAIEDGSRGYTYEGMFREWERYASVFSALGMTGAGRSRVGLLGSTCTETIFAVYGLNMVGADVSLVPAYSSLFPSNIINAIRSEKLTDFIVTDDFAQPNLVNELFMKKNELGLKNIILLHVPVNGVTVEPFMTMGQETKYRQLKGWYGFACMDQLLAVYGNYPISYAAEENSDTAFILHTSGTTSGGGKPVALSDKAFNKATASFYELKDISIPYDNLVTSIIVDLSNAYGIIDQVHLPFAVGGKVTVIPWGALNPNFYKAIGHYGITFLFTISAMFERWTKMPGAKGMDFSTLSFVALGGAAVSAADKRRYYEFMQKHGARDLTLLNGYGISELGGACCLSSPDIDDESIGYPLPGVNVRLYDDENDRFLPVDQRPCEGVFYLNSPSVATPVLDGKEILKAEYIDGKPYICTNDLVRVDEDGRVNFLGRANRYFINEEGRKYESGRVETEFSRQADIESCCVVPVYIKTLHDNIPMLCVKTIEAAEESLQVIHKALKDVFLLDETLRLDQVPSRVLIAEDLPRNRNGKIDLYKISRGDVEGDVYTVETISEGEKVTDFKLEPYQEGPADMIKEVLDGMSGSGQENTPFGMNKANNIKEEVANMNDNAKKAFENFNNMNQMGMQMMTDWMKNMMNGMGNMNQAGNGAYAPFWGMPNMQNMMPNMQGMMPDMQKMMESMQGMMPNMQGMMPDMQGMMPDMQTMMNNLQQMNQKAADNMQEMNKMAAANMKKMKPDMQSMMDSMLEINRKTAEKMEKMTPDMQKSMYVMESLCKTAVDMMPSAKVMGQNMQEMAQIMGSAIQDQFSQMLQCMRQMNQIGFEAMQKSLEVNNKMTELVFGGMQKIAETDWAAEEEKAEKAAEKKQAEAEKKEAKDKAAEVPADARAEKAAEPAAEAGEAKPVTAETPARPSQRRKSTKKEKKVENDK